MSNFSFSHSVSQGCQKVSLCGNGWNMASPFTTQSPNPDFACCFFFTSFIISPSIISKHSKEVCLLFTLVHFLQSDIKSTCSYSSIPNSKYVMLHIRQLTRQTADILLLGNCMLWLEYLGTIYFGQPQTIFILHCYTLLVLLDLMNAVC